MRTFPETELILTPDKRVYHINLKDEDIADNVIVVGDQKNRSLPSLRKLNSGRHIGNSLPIPEFTKENASLF
jgi:uridine phosphorylase